VGVVCSSAIEISNAAMERDKNTSRYGSEGFEVGTKESLDLVRSLAVLVLGSNNEERTHGSVFGRVVEVKLDKRCIAIAVVVVVLMIDTVI
jgi:hypothetical protein